VTLRLVATALLGCLLTPGSSKAATLTFRCPADGFAGYRDPGLVEALTITVDAGDGGTIELHGGLGDIALPITAATIQADVIAVQASGRTEAPMPDRAEIDACIARREQEDPRVMKGRRDMEVIRACQAAAPTVTAPVAMEVGIIATAPPKAQLLVKRGYPDEAGEASRRYAVDTIASCLRE
jgi:hypothetical protein